MNNKAKFKSLKEKIKKNIYIACEMLIKSLNKFMRESQNGIS